MQIRRRAILGLFAGLGALAWLGCARPLAPAAPPGSGWARAGPPPTEVASNHEGEVRVHFPNGTCETGWLEIEEFERAEGGRGAWRPHRDGSRIRTGSCRYELPERLLSEIRVRCIDPSDERRPSAWVTGVAVGLAAPSGACPTLEP